MRTARTMLLLVLAAEAKRCGPTDSEIASAFSLALPAAMLVGWGLLALLRWLWQRRASDISQGWKPTLVAGLLVLAIGTYGAVINRDGSLLDPGLVWIAFVLAGSSYATLLLVTWRVWFAARPASAFTWSFLPVVAVMVPPAVPMLLGGTSGWLDEGLAFLWIYPGWYGIPLAVVLAALIAEALIRRRAVPAGPTCTTAGVPPVG